MKIIDTGLPGVKVLKPRVHHDSRGYFLETWQMQRYAELLDTPPFVQHNQSFSRRGVLRGMHYQRRHGQGKLIRVIQGCIWDVVVDLRTTSPTFGQWLGMELTGIDPLSTGRPHYQLWVPPGMAHGFQVLSDGALVEYMCTAMYQPDDEFCLAWDDPDVAIDWPDPDPVLSLRDRRGRSLSELKATNGLPETAFAQES